MYIIGLLETERGNEIMQHISRRLDHFSGSDGMFEMRCKEEGVSEGSLQRIWILQSSGIEMKSRWAMILWVE